MPRCLSSLPQSAAKGRVKFGRRQHDALQASWPKALCTEASRAVLGPGSVIYTCDLGLLEGGLVSRVCDIHLRLQRVVLGPGSVIYTCDLGLLEGCLLSRVSDTHLRL